MFSLLRRIGRNTKASSIEEIQWETLLEVISDPILGVDVDGSPLFYNSAFAVLINEEKAITRRIWKMLLSHEVLEGFQKALKYGQGNAVSAVPFDLPNGKVFFSVKITPLRRQKGEVYGAVAVFHDVTDLKRAEQIRLDFVANVSHELRTPLTAIKGYTDTLIQDLESGRPPEKGFVQVIARNTERLLTLIHDLLDLSALESTDVIHRAEISTEEVTNRILAQMQRALQGKGQDVSVSLNSISVYADSKRLEQVMVNLLDNANKYTPLGGKISIYWDAEPGQATLLKVMDSGPGIPLDCQPRLFERFYRVDKARSREVGGTGLGLAIVKHIMQRHGGAVWVESNPGHGAAFFCRFPYQKAGTKTLTYS